MNRNKVLNLVAPLYFSDFIVLNGSNLDSDMSVFSGCDAQKELSIILQTLLSHWKLMGKVISGCSVLCDDGVTQFFLYESLVLFLVAWVNPTGIEGEQAASGGAPGPPALQEFVVHPRGGKECVQSLHFRGGCSELWSERDFQNKTSSEK